MSKRTYVDLIAVIDYRGRHLLFRMASDGTVEFFSHEQRRWVNVEDTSETD